MHAACYPRSGIIGVEFSLYLIIHIHQVLTLNLYSTPGHSRRDKISVCSTIRPLNAYCKSHSLLLYYVCLSLYLYLFVSGYPRSATSHSGVTVKISMDDRSVCKRITLHIILLTVDPFVYSPLYFFLLLSAPYGCLIEYQHCFASISCDSAIQNSVQSMRGCFDKHFMSVAIFGTNSICFLLRRGGPFSLYDYNSVCKNMASEPSGPPWCTDPVGQHQVLVVMSI